MRQLKNGALVIASAACDRHPGMEVVMAKTDQGYHPFVTWLVRPGGYAYWGHYFATAKEAMEDFVERCDGRVR